jgi:hypothetical protein
VAAKYTRIFGVGMFGKAAWLEQEGEFGEEQEIE